VYLRSTFDRVSVAVFGGDVYCEPGVNVRNGDRLGQIFGSEEVDTPTIRLVPTRAIRCGPFGAPVSGEL